MKETTRLTVALASIPLLVLCLTGPTHAQNALLSPGAGWYSHVTQGSDAQGCYYIVEYRQTWDNSDWAGSQPMAQAYYHGFVACFTNATITAPPQILDGIWFTAQKPAPATPLPTMVAQQAPTNAVGSNGSSRICVGSLMGWFSSKSL